MDAIRGKVFYSQVGEDMTVYESFFEKPQIKNGFFVELGAFDGLNLSNTKFFEDYLGWTGVLIEPVPEQFAKLKQNRPHCILVNAAVSRIDGEVDFLGNDGTAGMPSTMAGSFKDVWHDDDKESVYKVPSMPFSKILHQNNVKAIDFLSLDVEGGEFEVLDTFDWKIPVHVIAIELDGHNPQKDENCRKLLEAKGFKLSKKVDVSEIWSC